MKNFYLLIIFLFLLSSCSTDENPSKEVIAVSSKNPALAQNKMNPFDEKGKKYYELLSVYLKTNDASNSIKEITHQIQFVSKDFKSSNSTDKRTMSISDQDIVLIMNDPHNKLVEIVETSNLEVETKTTLLNFVQTLIDRQGDDYQDVYSYIIVFETNVIQSTTINQDDRDLILTISSISRYALYMEWSRKDRDWETSVGNRGNNPFFDINEEAIISLLAILDNLI